MSVAESSVSDSSIPRDYAAFISYRHSDNRVEGRQWASWLHHALETYEVPEDLVGTQNVRNETIPSRLFPIFRDEEELPADADLSTPILHALRASRFLVVLCSPGASASRFVADEITQFKAMGKSNRIVAAILSGEPNASSDAAKRLQGLPAEQECFPEPLRFEVDPNGTTTGRMAEPLAADFRLMDGAEGWTSPEAYRLALLGQGLDRAEISKRVSAYTARLSMMKLKVIAGIIGVPLGVLTQRDKAYQLAKERKRGRILRLWLAVVSLFAILAVVAGTVAWRNQRVAEARRVETVQALASSDFQQGTTALGEPDALPEGLAYMARAIRTGHHVLASTRVWTLLQQRPFWLPVSTMDVQSSALESSTTVREIPEVIRRRFAQVEVDGRVLETKFLDLSADGTRIAGAVGDVVDNTAWKVRVWAVDGTPLTPWFAPKYEGPTHIDSIQPHLSPDGSVLALVVGCWREPSYVELREVRPLKTIGDPITATGQVPNRQGASFSRVEFLPGVHSTEKGPELLLLIASERGDAAVSGIFPKQIEAGEVVELCRNEHATAVTFATVDRDQQWLVSSDSNGSLKICDLDAMTAVGQPIRLPQPVKQVVRTRPDALAVALQNGDRVFYHLQPPLVPRQPDNLHVADSKEASAGWAVSDESVPNAQVLAHSSGVRLLGVGPRQVGVQVDGTREPVQLSPLSETDISLVSVSGDGSHILITTRDFVTQMWSRDFSKRIGLPLNERALFGVDEIPESTRSVRVSPDGKFVLIESFFWDPPNLSHTWYSLWDATTGLPLMDRMHFMDYGFDDAAIDSVRFDSTGQFLLFLAQSSSGGTRIVSSIRLQLPADAESRIADVAEAIGGVKLDSQGVLATTPDRIKTLASFPRADILPEP